MWFNNIYLYHACLACLIYDSTCLTEKDIGWEHSCFYNLKGVVTIYSQALARAFTVLYVFMKSCPQDWSKYNNHKINHFLCCFNLLIVILNILVTAFPLSLRLSWGVSLVAIQSHPNLDQQTLTLLPTFWSWILIWSRTTLM